MTDRHDWRADALCRGSSLPWTRTETARYKDLLVMVAVCERCPSLTECRRDMREHQDYVGVRGGVVWTQPGGGKSVPSGRKPQPRICAWCDQPYEKPAEVRWTKYCSPECRQKAQRALDAKAARERKARRAEPLGASTLRVRRYRERIRDASQPGVNIRSALLLGEKQVAPAQRELPGTRPTPQGGVDMAHGTQDARHRAESAGR